MPSASGAGNDTLTGFTTVLDAHTFWLLAFASTDQAQAFEDLLGLMAERYNKDRHVVLILVGDPATGKTPLHHAVERGQAGMVVRLLGYYCLVPPCWQAGYIDRPDYAGETALHKAARRGDAKLCDLLLDMGASPDRRDRAGLSPIDVADGAALHDHLKQQQGRRVDEEVVRGRYVRAMEERGLL